MSASGNAAIDQGLLDWEFEQLVKTGVYPNHQAALRSALRALFQVQPQAKVRMVAGAYQAGDIGLGRAAAMLGVSQEEMKDMLREMGVDLHLGPQTVHELIEDASNA